ncbi:MAG TPA: NnrS family protein, partial [Thermoanaerobaculia bacterium]|nr:NnrS family protein [Thermoanaerobaculia bacterium]
RSDPILSFVALGTIFFVVAAAFLAAQGFWLAGHAETAAPTNLTEPFYFAALYGFLLAWIYGFGNRVVSLFLGVGPALRGTPQAALVLQAVAVPIYLASYLPDFATRPALALRDAGMSAAALSALVYLAGHGLVWRRTTLPMLPTPGRPTLAIRCAFGCLGLWAVLELAAVGAVRMTRFPARNLWWADAARHTFTIGFLTLLIVGMSLRILPVFSGRKLWSPRLAYGTYGLLLGATAMRLLQYPAAFRPVLYQVGSFMGVAVVLALVLFAFNLVRTMRGGPKRTLPARPFSSVLPVRN